MATDEENSTSAHQNPQRFKSVQVAATVQMVSTAHWSPKAMSLKWLRHVKNVHVYMHTHVYAIVILYILSFF